MRYLPRPGRETTSANEYSGSWKLPSSGAGVLRRYLLQSFQELLGRTHFFKPLLFRLKLRRMYASASAAQFYRVLQMQHLVIDDVLNHISRNLGMIEHAAHHDGIVRRIIVAQPIACTLA